MPETPSTSNFDVDNLKQPMAITVGSTVFLGQLKKETDKLSVVDAVAIDATQGIESSHLAQYCLEAIQGNCTTIDIHGMAQVSSQELNQDLSLDWEITILKLKRAILKGPINAVIDAFNRG